MLLCHLALDKTLQSHMYETDPVYLDMDLTRATMEGRIVSDFAIVCHKHVLGHVGVIPMGCCRMYPRNMKRPFITRLVYTTEQGRYVWYIGNTIGGAPWIQYALLHIKDVCCMCLILTVRTTVLVNVWLLLSVRQQIRLSPRGLQRLNAIRSEFGISPW